MCTCASAHTALTDNVRWVYKERVMHLADYMAGKNPQAKPLSDDEVAAGIGRNRATVSRIRRKKVRPDWRTIEKIEAFTGGLVTANDFSRLPIQQTKIIKRRRALQAAERVE